MENAGYIALNRQAGLLKSMETVATNIANASTGGYRRESVIFTEYIIGTGRHSDSLSIGHANGRVTDFRQGGLQQTNGAFDISIEGDGFFLLATPDGDRLTRAGAFLPSPDGLLVAPDGAALLDAGGAPILVPANTNDIAIGADGTLSSDGEPIAQIGLWAADNPLEMTRVAGTRFAINGEPVPKEGGRIIQGFLEQSNVNPVAELTRMIEVQRAYELGAKFLDREDERVRSSIRVMGQ